jgi:4-hydroxybenzoate polyprenyltransferase
MGKIVSLLRCTSCRFASFYFIPFLGGLAGAGEGRASWVLPGAIFWLSLSVGTEAVNRLSDRTEDEINRPERTAICHECGFRLILRTAIAAWLVAGGLAVAALVARPGLPLAVLLVLGALSAVGYSYGPKLSRHRYASLVVLTFPFGGTFLIGWAIGHPMTDSAALRDLLLHAGPVAVAGGLSIGALAGIKDLTDVPGDAAVGSRALWVSVIRDHTGRMAVALAAAPFAIMVAFVAGGLLTMRFLALLCLLPLATMVACGAGRAQTPPQLLATRELFYQYWIVLESVAMILYAPQLTTVLGTLAAVVWWVIASRYLHWTRLTPAQWLSAFSPAAAESPITAGGTSWT